MHRIGIDLGGTKIEGVVLNRRGEVCARHRLDTPQGDYPAILQCIQSLVEYLRSAIGDQPVTVGVCTPGAVSSLTGKMKNCNSTCLNHQDLLSDIQQLLQRPVRIANDANCFALSEAVDGAAEQANVVFGVILGTGVGGGIVVNKKPLAGANRIAGEWGHNELPQAAQKLLEQPEAVRECYCGRQNCIETFLSGPGMVQSYGCLTGDYQVSARKIAALAKRDNAAAKQIIELYAQQLACCLGQVINILDPQVIVLGGGLSNISQLYQQVPNYWQHTVFSDQLQTTLLPARYGDASGVRGAAWLWNE